MVLYLKFVLGDPLIVIPVNVEQFIINVIIKGKNDYWLSMLFLCGFKANLSHHSNPIHVS